MALVVLLRGVNIGGHKTFRPTMIAEQLKHLDVVNIGAAGTFVIRKPVKQAQLRSEIIRRLPFDSKIVICQGKAILDLVSNNPFRGARNQPGTKRFVSVLSQAPRLEPSMPISLPSTGRWLVKIQARTGRFIVGMYRPDMKVIGHLGTLDRLFGVPLTSRSWNTFIAIARVLLG